MEIINLPIEDWEEYRNLRLKALKEDPQAFGDSYSVSLKYGDERWKKRLEDALDGEKIWLFFAKDGNKLVGMAGAFMEEGSTDTATIVSVYVPVEERGRDISWGLMEELLKTLSQKAYLKKAKLKVRESQTAAVGLYKKSGFQEVGKEPYKLGNGDLVDMLVMEKTLRP